MNDDKIGLGKYSYQEIASKDILELIGLNNLSAEEEQEYRNEIDEAIKMRATARIVDALNNADADTWSNFNTDEEKEKFLKEKGINVGKIMIEEALIYKLETVSLASKITNK